MNIFGDHEEGVMHFRSGEVAHLMIQRSCTDFVFIRWESGWYVTYRPDGTRVRPAYMAKDGGSSEQVIGGSKRDVIRFDPMTWREAKVAFPNIAGEICP